MSDCFSLAQARHLVLAAQGFARAPRSAIGARQLRTQIDRIGELQIDSVNALVRSYYLPVFSRLGHYDSRLLYELAWGTPKRRGLFEYCGHKASLLLLELYPLMRWRMRRAAYLQGAGAFRAGATRCDPRVLQALRELGALGAASLSTRTERSSP